MSMKRVVGAAAVAASVGLSAMTQNAGFAYAVPLDPPCPNCNSGPGGWPQEPPTTTVAPANTEPRGGERSEPPSTQSSAAPSTQSSAAPSTQSSAAPSTQSSAAPSTQSTETQTTQSTAAPSTQSSTTASSAPSATASSTESTTASSTPSTTGSSTGSTTASSTESTTGSSTQNKPWAARSTHPPPPPFVPHEDFVRGTAEVGGPIDASVGFSIVGPGAPPPPRERGFGWNDGPPPGGPPPH